jgi:hypothetical protein
MEVDVVKPEDIKWGSYDVYEGPVFWGTQKHTIPPRPQQGEAILGVITTTEGGAYDAYNGYDKCICTSGLIQWCDRAPWFLVCKLLGSVARKNSALLAPVVEFASLNGYTFGQTSSNEWRFWDTEGDVVDSVEKQRRLYLGGSSGRKGGWSEAQRWHAKAWAAACSSVWQQPAAQLVQRGYTVSRLFAFATSKARGILSQADEVGNDVGKAFQAAYLSFAANNPKKAGQALEAAIADVGVRWTENWLIDVLHHLTFDPGIAIYPHRYDKIRPVLERVYDVDLPDFSGHLKQWAKKNEFGGVLDPKELQRALISLGYDIGPAGADGIFGERTRLALKKFEKDVLVPDAWCDGYPDQYTVPRLEAALQQKGDKLNWKDVA